MGAGVTGLTCAIRLAEAGHRVDVLARDLPLETTSVVAAALWYPYLAEPRDRVGAWGAGSYRVFAGLASEEGSGVTMMPGTEVLPARTEDPWWASAVPDLEHARPPAGYADAWSFTAPVVDMPVYLQWLRARLDCLGGTLTRISLGALPQPSDPDDVVVNCSGLGSRLLARDTTTQPVRGQVVLVEGVDLTRWSLDSTGPTYVVPRSRHVVVGGTEEPGTGAGPRPRTRPPTSSSAPPGSCPSSPAPASWVTAWDSGRLAPPYAWRRRVGPCTATARAAPA